MKVTQVIKEAITTRVMAKCAEANKGYLWEKNMPSFNLNVTSDYAKDLKAKIQENQDKAKKFINDIILKLELEENKPTLESLLANVKF